MKKIQRNDVPTFEETVKEILSYDLNEGNHHYKPITHLCSPCHTLYDAIIKIESYDKDTKYVINSAGISNIINPDQDHHLHSSTKDEGEDKRKELFLQQVHNRQDKNAIYDYFYSQISPELKQKLYEKYAADFLLFGYSFNGSEPVSLD